MRPALVIVDIIKDNVETDKHHRIVREAREIVPPLQRFIEFARAERIPIVYANDSLLRGDFVFQGKMCEHALRGTEGTRVIDELVPAGLRDCPTT